MKYDEKEKDISESHGVIDFLMVTCYVRESARVKLL